MPPDRRKLASTNAENEAWLVRSCPFSYTLALIGRRWRPASLWKLPAGPLHVAELARRLPRASEKDALSGPPRAAIVARRAEAGRTVYSRTARGDELGPVLAAMPAPTPRSPAP